MSKKDDGGFAISYLTVRDWFAGQMLTFLANRVTTDPPDVAKWAYKYADAMLAERKRLDTPSDPMT